MTEATTEIFIAITDDPTSFDGINIDEITFETGQLTQSKSPLGVKKTIASFKNEIKELLQDKVQLFSKEEKERDYLLKSACVIGYKVITWCFFNYNFYLMCGSPKQLDTLCREVLELLKSQQKKGDKFSQIIDLLMNNLQINRQNHLRMLEEDYMNKYLDIKKSEYNCNEKYFMFKKNKLSLSYLQIVLLLAKKSEEPNILQDFIDNLKKFLGVTNNVESRNAILQYLNYLQAKAVDDKFDQVIIKQQLEKLKRIVICNNSLERTNDQIQEDTISSEISQSKSSQLCALDEQMKKLLISPDPLNNRTLETFTSFENILKMDQNCP